MTDRLLDPADADRPESQLLRSIIRKMAAAGARVLHAEGGPSVLTRPATILRLDADEAGLVTLVAPEVLDPPALPDSFAPTDADRPDVDRILEAIKSANRGGLCLTMGQIIARCQRLDIDNVTLIIGAVHALRDSGELTVFYADGCGPFHCVMSHRSDATAYWGPNG